MFKNYISKSVNKYASRWLVLAIDCVLVLQTFFLAYFIRFNFSFNFDSQDFIYQQPLVLVLALVSFLVVGSYKGVVRHTGVKDAFNVMYAVSLLSFLLVVLVLMNSWLQVFSSFTIPLSIIVIHYLLNVVVLIASRFVFKIIYNRIMFDFK
jgi:FlaA1/EpsC-like NDP-sugar epimerase